jgi:hypothetical protein
MKLYVDHRGQGQKASTAIGFIRTTSHVFPLKVYLKSLAILENASISLKSLQK